MFVFDWCVKVRVYASDTDGSNYALSFFYSGWGNYVMIAD